MIRRLVRAVVTGFVAWVTGELEVLDPWRAERMRREAAEHRAVKPGVGPAKVSCPSFAWTPP